MYVKKIKINEILNTSPPNKMKNIKTPNVQFSAGQSGTKLPHERVTKTVLTQESYCLLNVLYKVEL